VLSNLGYLYGLCIINCANEGYILKKVTNALIFRDKESIVIIILNNIKDTCYY
jgi:hypothetical protein